MLNLEMEMVNIWRHSTLGIRAHPLRMVMETKYYAFRFGDEGHPNHHPLKVIFHQEW